MKIKITLLSVLLGAGLVASASAAAARGNAGNGRGSQGQTQRGNPSNPDRMPRQDGSGGCQGQSDCVPNPDCEPKRDGSGGPHKPADRDCPQDGSGCPRG
jgi:hypothetical protein